MQKKAVIVTLLVVIFLLWQGGTLLPDGKLHVYICDVGQGDGIYIRTPNGNDVVIDGGPDEKILDCLSQKMPFFDRKIELVFLSHKQSDHLTGLLTVFDRYEIGEVFATPDTHQSGLTEVWDQAIHKHHLKLTVATAGIKITTADGVVLNLFWPEKNHLSRDPNDYSSVIKLQYENFTSLFTGDLGLEAQNLLINKRKDEVENVTLLKIPHHGSNTNLSKEFTQTISPQIAAISVGKNSFGHPGQKVLNLLNDLQTKVYRTDQNGTIEIQTDGKSYKVITKK